MATYGNIYRMEFRDAKNLLWRVDFRLKNAGDTETPLMIANGGGSPVVINWGDSDENQFEPIISSRAEVTYYYTGPEVPSPELFIDIEEDEWLLVISKLPDNSTPVVQWKGFITPSSNRYPWLPPPFDYTLNAVDFSFSKGKDVNLDDNNLFLYDFVTVGDFLNRTLFHSVGYDDSLLKILFNIKPDSIGSGLITNSVYMHTDSVFDFTDGAMTCYDGLKQFLSSVGSRMIYSAGSYWLQRIQDLNDDVQDIVTITPDNTIGVQSVNYDVAQPLGNSVSDTVIYLNKSQYLVVNPALKKQTVTYDLKTINQIKNFDWRTDETGPYDFWEGVNTNVYTRSGAGSLEDPFRILVPPPAGATIYQPISIEPGKRLSVELKVRGFLTLPSPDSVNYSVWARCIVVVVDAAIPTILGYTLGQEGTWKPFSTSGGLGEGDYYRVSTKGKADFGTLEITSAPVPGGWSSNMQVWIVIVESGIDPAPPPGSTYYTQFYPPYLGIYNNEYIKIKEDIVNTKVYSLSPDNKERFYLDQSDNGLSNCLFYNDGVMKAIPQDDWSGKTIDETVLRGELDQQNKAGYSFDGDVYSNSLSFHHVVTLTDFNNKKMMLLRDKYDVMSCKHSIYATEIMPVGSGIGTYTVTPLTKKEDS